jgi:hypothetical protein
MKHFSVLLLLFVAFISCEGRKTQNQALAEDIEDFKKVVSYEVNVYVPETYMEREVDTLLSNGFYIKIKTYSDMDNSVLFTKIKDTVNYQTYHRNFKFDIIVKKNDELLLNRHFDKKSINKLFKYDTVTKSNIEGYDFYKLGVLNSIQIDTSLQSTDLIKIDIIYAIPETNRRSLHSLFIDDKGVLEVERLETN